MYLFIMLFLPIFSLNNKGFFIFTLPECVQYLVALNFFIYGILHQCALNQNVRLNKPIKFSSSMFSAIMTALSINTILIIMHAVYNRLFLIHWHFLMTSAVFPEFVNYLKIKKIGAYGSIRFPGEV